jgi:GTPase SAR1 family protein
MTKSIEFQNRIISVINKLDYKKEPHVDDLKDARPNIFLIGKSSSGKTMLLNAMLGIEKDELPVSTNITTKSIFKVRYASDKKYIVNSRSRILPLTIKERKELFKSLNEQGEEIAIEFPAEILKHIDITDIPGVFDFQGSTNFIDKSFHHADCILFLTSSLNRIGEKEYELLKKFNSMSIPIVVLFTKADITNPDEGLDRASLPLYIEDRLKRELKNITINGHFTISSADYFSQKNEHGIDKVLDYLKDNSQDLLTKGHDRKIARLRNHYSDMITAEIGEMEHKHSEFEKNKIRLIELEYQEKERKLIFEKSRFDDKIKILFEELESKCMSQIMSYRYRPDTYQGNTITGEERLERLMNEWNRIMNKIINILKENNIDLESPALPEAAEVVFKPLEIDTGKLSATLKSIEEIIFNFNGLDSLDATTILPSLQEIGMNFNNAHIMYQSYMYYSEVIVSIYNFRENITQNYDRSFKMNIQDIKDAQERDTLLLEENSPYFKRLQSLREAKEELYE